MSKALDKTYDGIIIGAGHHGLILGSYLARAGLEDVYKRQAMEDVRNAIVNANAAGPLGSFDGGKRAVTIGINDQLKTADEYDPLVVKTINGTVIRLSTVASITPSVRNTQSAGWFNKQPSVLLIITKQGSANVIDTVRCV